MRLNPLSRPPSRAWLWGLVYALAIAAPAAPLRVGIDLDGEPMTFVDAKGVPRGFAVDIMNGIAREMDFQVVYVAKPWAEMYEDFLAGDIDALANITYTRARAEVIEFTDPHIVMTGAIFVRKGDDRITSAIDLRKLRVAVKPGGAPYAYLQARGWANDIVATDTLRNSLRAVAEGRADAALDARLVGTKNIRDEHLTNLEVADVALLDFAQRLHIGLHRGDTATAALINDGLARLRASGAYDRIYEQWIGPLEPPRLRFKDVQPYLPAAAAVLLLIVGALVWQRRLLQRMARQTEALWLGEERLKLVLEGSEAGFWDWDMRTGHVERSERWAAMLGYSVAEIPPTIAGALQLIHPEDRPHYEACHGPQMRDADVRSDFEYRMRTKSGEWRWVHDRGKVVSRAPDGTPLRMAGTHIDITQLKEAEAEREVLHQKMIESQKLESLGVLAGGIAHDFNNLLTVILANATLARLDATSPATPDEPLAQIETAARRAADLCRQMLAYAGKGSFIIDRINLGALVQDTAELLKVSLSKKARLTVDLAPDLPAVEADASQLRQVVMNLIINASEALGEDSGQIRLVTTQAQPQPGPHDVVHAFGPAEANTVCLEITDTGHGMDTATLANIFDPFFTTKFTGRGLGLAAVLGIVRACRGTFLVTSTPGRGSTFRLFLPPAAPAPASDPPPPPPAPFAAAHGTLLIADDEPSVRQTTAAMVRHQGFQTVLAADGEEAVRLFRAHPRGFAAVLIDLLMPGLNGAEVLREIRALNPEVRVIMMSGFSPQDVLNRLAGLGPFAILHKPFTLEDLQACLAEATAPAPRL